MIPVTQIITFLKYALTLGYAYYLEKREKFLFQSFEDEQAVYAILELLGDNIKADRIELVYMHNGGGRLVPGVEKYVKVANEVCLTGKLLPRNAHHSRKVDNSFLSKIAKMMFADNGIIIIDIDKLTKGFLKSAYQEEGVKQAIASYVASNEKYMWYISMQFSEEKHSELTDELLNNINDYRSRICGILKKYFIINHTC